jgi:hypothetical protein
MGLPNRRLSPAMLVLAVAVTAGASAGAQAQSAFYMATDPELAGASGTIIRAQPMRGAPDGAAAYRVLYRSVGLRDQPIAVSGIVVVPAGPAPAGGRPIVAWAHPTTGVVPHCAPSLAMGVFRQIQGLRAMLARGYAVAATDYPGLGTPGPHPYLVGVSEGRAVIDSVRAARAMSGVGAAAILLFGAIPRAGKRRSTAGSWQRAMRRSLNSPASLRPRRQPSSRR